MLELIQNNSLFMSIVTNTSELEKRFKIGGPVLLILLVVLFAIAYKNEKERAKEKREKLKKEQNEE